MQDSVITDWAHATKAHKKAIAVTDFIVKGSCIDSNKYNFYSLLHAASSNTGTILS